MIIICYLGPDDGEVQEDDDDDDPGVCNHCTTPAKNGKMTRCQDFLTSCAMSDCPIIGCILIIKHCPLIGSILCE